MKELLTLIYILFGISCLNAQQIWSEPERPAQDAVVSIFFDANQCECPLENQNLNLYAHTGLIIEGINYWDHVIGNWGQNNIQPMLENLGNGLYKLEIAPDIESFYQAQGKTIEQMAFVFRNSDGSQQTADLFIDVFQNDGLTILSPMNGSIHKKSEIIDFQVVSLQADSMEYSFNGSSFTRIQSNEIDFDFSFDQTGRQELTFRAYIGELVQEKTISILIADFSTRSPVPLTPIQNGVQMYDDSTALFVLQAPGKENVFLTGDFNNWEPKLQDQLFVDPTGEYFWILKSGLKRDLEYAYQYIIDGELFLADPYSEKVLDPFNDPYIDTETYPDLKAYPINQAQNIVSVFQMESSEFSWQNDEYDRPKEEELVIYELLIREFTYNHNYQSLIDTLDYLEDLGINAIELMPVNEFEGNSSWGYNTSFHFALDKYYGTPEDFKMFIDECHSRGIAVILDIVLNHVYSQNPMVQMYWNEQMSRPAANNPWFNEISPNQTFSFGYDFNHDMPRTQAYSKDVLSYWIEEYHIDGYRLDFTKGLTQTPGDGGGFDAGRIRLLKDYASHIWSVDSDAYVILEHFAPRSEEIELTDAGMMVWGNHNHNFAQIAMGYQSGSNFDYADYRERGMNQPLVIPYMESHDEERQMFKTQMWGNANGSYQTKEFATAIERSKMASLLYFTIPGPKMIWMFGEYGFDISIDDPCRICEKPVFWDEASNDLRTELRNHYRDLIHLRDSLDIFHTKDFAIDAGSAVKKVLLRKDDKRILAISNSDVVKVSEQVDFEETGEWFEYFSGHPLQLEDRQETLELAPGEYRLYSNFQISEINEPEPLSFSLFPNPGDGLIQIRNEADMTSYSIRNALGQVIESQEANLENEIDIRHYPSGVYFLELEFDQEETRTISYMKI
jgi:1,4-alpha-glucan branching enzyme